jgi:hypothetical protein
VTLFLGVDPGIGGAWAVLRDDGTVVACGLGGKSKRGGLDHHVVDLLTAAREGHRGPLVAAMEAFPPRPGQHVKSIAGLWRGVGAWELAVGDAGWPEPVDVAPKSWQSQSLVATYMAEEHTAERERPGHEDLAAKTRRTRLQQAGRVGYHRAACERWPDLARPGGPLWGARGARLHDLAAALWIAERARTA